MYLKFCLTLQSHLHNNIQEGAYEAIYENKQLIQLILDSYMDILKGIVTLTKRNHIDIEQITTGIFLLSQEHSQRDQIYVFKILFNSTVTPSPNSVCTYGTRFSSTILYR
jgi:hypothetical protein